MQEILFFCWFLLFLAYYLWSMQIVIIFGTQKTVSDWNGNTHQHAQSAYFFNMMTHQTLPMVQIPIRSNLTIEH